MLSSFDVLVLFSETEINNVDNFLFLVFPHHEIIGLDVSVHKSFSMDLLQAIGYLNSDVYRGRYAELFPALSERWYHF